MLFRVKLLTGGKNTSREVFNSVTLICKKGVTASEEMWRAAARPGTRLICVTYASMVRLQSINNDVMKDLRG